MRLIRNFDKICRQNILTSLFYTAQNVKITKLTSDSGVDTGETKITTRIYKETLQLRSLGRYKIDTNVAVT